jgi:hypothetical protein
VRVSKNKLHSIPLKSAVNSLFDDKNTNYVPENPDFKPVSTREIPPF